MLKHFVNVPMGILTAWKSELEDAENESRNRELEAGLKEKGLGYIKTQGFWLNSETEEENPEELEPGFTVPNMSFADAIELAKEYDQWSFFWSNGKGRAFEFRTEDGEP